MMKVSLFKNFANHVGNSTLEECLQNIKAGNYIKEIEQIREANTTQSKEEADKLKRNLLAFTPSATFNKVRKLDNIVEYNACIILDFDDINPSFLQDAKAKAEMAVYSFAVFISPRGTGLKIIVKVDTDIVQHKTAFLQVADYYEQALQESVDPSGKDATRLCFVSYDEELYYNPEAEVYNVNLIEEKKAAEIDNLFEEAVAFTNQKQTYQEGNRNNYIYLLACNCNRKGISEAEALQQIILRFDLPTTEIEKSVQSAYHNHLNEFGQFKNIDKAANFANIAESANPSSNITSGIDALRNTPHIPDFIFSSLPINLRKATNTFPDDKRRRDVFLTSALVILSGCFNKVRGIYHQENMFPNLFSFVIAPAASGKGVLNNAKRLLDKWHNAVVKESKESRQLYEQEMVQYKADCTKLKKGEQPPEKPIEPPFKTVLIPADTSQAKLLQMINANDGFGIICETEADTMVGATKQDWGNYSHILRNSFHHEKVSVARKSETEIIEIPEPKLSICLSGTPAQVFRLISSAEDGLFSRFIFYAFKSDPQWKSPKPNGIVYNELFDGLSEEVLEMITFLEKYPTQVFLTDHQWDQFDNQFQNTLAHTIAFTDDDIAGVVYRLGLITFRLCMIFSAMRKFEDGCTDKEVYCTDNDFNNAITLSKIYIEHSMLLYTNLSSHEEVKIKLPKTKQAFINALPNIFTRKEAVAIGKNFNIPERTIDDTLSKQIGIVFQKIDTGKYEKII